ncbi:MAG TPA: oligosaccharide flippase family protein [Thermoleophilaceae bacterium]|nr:oligosaccharide flippase family protein [Thermoleophilaceae bacterium]
MQLPRDRNALWRSFASSDTGRAAGLAVAVIATNVIALVFTVVFARVLGADGYGSLAVLISAFIILMVPGSALQIAVAREVSKAVADASADAGAGVRRWTGRLALATVAVAVAVIPLRELIAATVNVDEEWAAAAVPVTAMLWALISVERGALQGFQQYRTVGISMVAEGGARLLFGLALVGLGLDVTGAFLGTPLSLLAVAAALAVPLHGHLPAPRAAAAVAARLRDLLRGACAPVLGLTLLFVLQEVHVIVVKHEATDDAASSYAVAAVAAKAIIWVAIGLGLFLLPETARRARLGIDARPVLLRTLGLIAVLGLPMVLLYAAAGEPLLRIVFGEDLTAAVAALPWLGVAMSLLACSYLSVQYLLGLGRSRFIWLLAVAALVEVGLLAGIGANLEQIAVALMGLQAVCAAVIVTLSFRTYADAPQDGVVAEALDLGVLPGEVAVEGAHAARPAGAVGLGLGRHRAEPADH